VIEGQDEGPESERASRPAEGESASVRLVCFHLRDQEFAFPIGAVRETLKMRPITRVFLTPRWLSGIFSLRGEIVPAIDLSSWLGMPPVAVDDESRLVVLRRGTLVLGVVTSRLAELRNLAPDELGPTPTTLAADQAALLRGVAVTKTGTVRVLDPDAILRSEQMRSLTADASF
jgi:purine-binding chemotaxis protein CheW